ncbi:MAG: response regulator, partial [Deltaproteobacteria bacterium]
MKAIEDTTILVVDDDKFNVTLMRELCNTIGYRVVEAKNGFEALRKVGEQRPDLILLDLMMTGKSGFEVCQELKSDKSTADIPIIIVTALDDLESKMRGIKLGADDYVTKPFRLFELQQRIASVLEARHYRRLFEETKRKLQRQGD